MHKQLLVGVFTGQQIDQQFVQVITTEQRPTLQQGLSPLPFSIVQGDDFALTAPGYFEWLKAHEHPAHGRAWATYAFRNQGHAAVVSGDGFDN